MAVSPVAGKSGKQQPLNDLVAMNLPDLRRGPKSLARPCQGELRIQNCLVRCLVRAKSLKKPALSLGIGNH